jgi:hypothetical protein
MLDREYVVRAAVAQAGGVLALGVHLAGGDDGAFQVPDQGDQVAEHRDLVGLGGIHRELGHDSAGIAQRGQQHRRLQALAAAGGALRGLAVDVDAAQQVTGGFPAQCRGPGAERLVQLIAVRALQRPGDRGGVRGRHGPVGAGPAAERGEQPGRGAGRPFPDRGQLAVPGHHRHHRDRQQVRQAMPPAPPATGIIHPRQESGQPRASGLIQPDGPARLAAGGGSGQHHLRRVPRRPPGPGPRRRPGQRSGQLRRHPGRQPRRDQRRQLGDPARGQLRRHAKGRRLRHHRRQHIRDGGAMAGGTGNRR